MNTGGSQAVNTITSLVRKGPTPVATRRRVPEPGGGAERNSRDSASAIHSTRDSRRARSAHTTSGVAGRCVSTSILATPPG